MLIAHDFMETYGGAERVTAEMARAFPEAPVVAIVGSEAVAERMGIADRFRSLLPEWPSLHRYQRLLTPALSTFVDRRRLPATDVVLSSSSALAQRLRARGARRICYCHSPLRFAWTMTDTYEASWGGREASRRAFEVLSSSLRRRDRAAAEGIDVWLTHSAEVAAQIEAFHGRHADVIGAPVDLDRFHPGGGPVGGHFLACGRPSAGDRGLAVLLEAFRTLPGERLVVAGGGPGLEAARRSAPANVELVGELDDAGIAEAMRTCRALVFPSREAFGLAPLEAMACGRPVIAFAGGWARDVVVPGLTGMVVRAQTAEAFAAAVGRFRDDAWDAGHIREHALRWDAGRFRARLVEAAERAVTAASGAPGP